ncbi:MAG: hypothetical protein JW778_03590 [Candidatus Altiarchaeota archaeon]|nr:hypothetical protein [Candidatus Altiarchaeota archaeon]
MHKKAQISNFDLVIAAGIFLFILFVMIGTWGEMTNKINHFEDRRSTYYKGLDITEMLVKTPGNPPNWEQLDTLNPSTVYAVGFSSQPNVLDKDKLERFDTFEYEQMRDLLGLSREDFHLLIHDVKGADEIPLYSFGNSINRSHIRVDRYAILEDNLVRLSLKLYY